MSTEYFIFVNSNNINEVLRVMSTVGGVELRERQLLIDGLLSTEVAALDPLSREIMREDYGEYGLDVNWRIGGTHDESFDVVELIVRLFSCAAAVVNTWPDNNVSVMRNGESFYMINTSENLIISGTYVKERPCLVSLFKKTAIIRNM